MKLKVWILGFATLLLAVPAQPLPNPFGHGLPIAAQRPAQSVSGVQALAAASSSCNLTEVGDGLPDNWGANLRLLFFGIDDASFQASQIPPAPVAANCASSARQGLVQSCSLYHLYRNDDSASATGLFKQQLSVPADQPFCNAPGVSVSAHNDQVDADPIRVPCSHGEDVCRCDGSLGLILPIAIPSTEPNYPSSVLYPSLSCSGAAGLAFNEKNSNGAPVVTSPNVDPWCSDGSEKLYFGCVYPKTSIALGSSPSCMFHNVDRTGLSIQSLLRSGTLGNPLCPDADGPNDVRALNLDVRSPAAILLASKNPNDPSIPDWQGRAFFRVHSFSGTTETPGPAECQELSATRQIHCLVARDTQAGLVSVGLAESDGECLGAPGGTPCGVVGACDGAGTCEPILPPDPAMIAPAVPRATTLSESDRASFLYSGSNPVQTGVAPNTIDPARAGVIRGRVMGTDGLSLPLVKVTVLGHDELGGTRTREDGKFDIVVNAGEQLTLEFELGGYITGTRNIVAKWNDSIGTPDVILAELDTQVSSIDLEELGTQVVTGSTSDPGTAYQRQPLLFFKQGTTAIAELPDHSTHPLDVLNVHITEFTKGTNGPATMPADLPATSAYTYAIEFTSDEAVELKATTTRFSQPASLYVNNFLRFPVGSSVPSGSYERTKGQWVAEPNGRIVKILGVSAGQANIDIDGVGNAATATQLAAIGIDTAERIQLALSYPSATGVELWRVPVSHFTMPLDLNWPYTPNDPSPPIDPPPPPPNDPPQDPPFTCGSIIDVASQTLGERLPIQGTPIALHYSSDRVPGRRDQYQVRIPVSSSTIPPGDTTVGYQVEVSVEGNLVTQTFPSAANLDYLFEWDGRDAYGRLLQGRHAATISVGRVVPAKYAWPSGLPQAFGQFSDAAPGMTLTSDRTRNEITTWRRFTRAVGAADVRETSVAGWTVDLQHWYDPIGQTMYLGDGTRRSVTELGVVLEPYAGLPNALSGDQADGLPAANAEFSTIQSIAVGPDGALYVAASDVYRIDPKTNIVNKIIGNPSSCATTPMPADGGPALTSCIGTNKALAVAPNGKLYVADRIGSQSLPRIRRVDADGTIHLVAGGVAATGNCDFQGNGGPIANARLCPVIDIDVGPDGSLYTMEKGTASQQGGSAWVRRISPDGYVNGLVFWVASDLGNGGISAGRDGSVYVVDFGRHAVNRLTPDRKYYIVAGNFFGNYTGDGGPGNAASLNNPDEVTVAPDGTLYISDRINNALRSLDPKGIIHTYAGGPTAGTPAVGDNGPPGKAGIGQHAKTALAPDGTLYIAQEDRRIRRVRSGVPGGALPGNFLVAAEHADEVYEFNKDGRHLRTIHALTGATLWTFTYDVNGMLSSITDGDGNITSFTRDSSGRPTQIVGPYNETTALQTDSNGFLSKVTEPSTAFTSFTYSPTGLMQTMTDANGGLHQFTFDAEGRLQRDQNAAGGYTAFTHTAGATSSSVTGTTAENVVSQFTKQLLDTGIEQRSYRSGITTATTTAIDIGKQTETKTRVDGTVVTKSLAPDPRWGIRQALPAATTRTPAGKQLSASRSSTVALSTPSNPFSLSAWNRTDVQNGTGPTDSYNPTTRELTHSSAAGRTTTTTLDLQGRATRVQIPNVNPIQMTYDTHGRLSTRTQGTRTTTYTYDTKGRLQTEQNPLNQLHQFEYDLGGRLNKHTFPGGAFEQFGYDAMGLRTSVTPPGRPAHAFAYTPDNHLMTYTAPSVGAGGTTTGYSYNLDGKLLTATRPDALSLSTTYDTAGRPSVVTLPGGSTTYSYHATQGTLTSITGPYATNLAYNYDGHLLLSVTWSGGVQGSVSWVYDDLFRKTQETVTGAAGTAVTKFGYDSDNLLTCASPTNCTPPGSDALVLTRGLTNTQLTARNLGGVTESLTYNSYGELATQTVRYNGAEVYSVTYDGTSVHRDGLGRVMQKVERIQGTPRTEDYQYDSRGRLTDLLVNSSTASHWDYDSNSNRLASTGPCPAATSDYDNQDRLTHCGSYTFTYTANGELATKVQSGVGTTTYTYDVLGNLTRVVLPNATIIDYLIDGENRRVGKKVNGTVVKRWLYHDGLKPVAELDGTGALVSQFVYGSNPNVPDYVVKSGVKYRIAADQLGSVRLVINVSTGAIAQVMQHDAWGNVVQDTSVGFTPFGFAGGFYDPDTGLVRFGARDYDPVVGRWTTKEPRRFIEGPSLYVYVSADPVNFIDMNGHYAGVAGGAELGAEIGAAVGGPVGAVVGAAVVAVAIAIIVDPPKHTCLDDGDGSDPPPPPDCDQEWTNAFEQCAELITGKQTRTSRRLRGGANYGLYECAMGFVSQRCGGNRLD